MRRGLRYILLPTALGIAAGSLSAGSGLAEYLTPELRVKPGFGAEDGLAEGWSRYAQARIEGRPADASAVSSPDPPPFDEEVYAREFLARYWSELAVRNGWSNRYLEELALVQRMGFIREYSWECLHVLRGLEPSGLEVEAFRRWLREHLPEHRVETWVAVRRSGGTLAFEVGRPPHEPYRCVQPR